MANYRKKLFALLADLSGSPLAQDDAINHVATVAGMKVRLVKAEAKATKAAKAAQPEDAPSIEDATEGVAYVAPDRYWLQMPNGREWVRRGAEDIARKLRERGLTTKRIPGEELSAVDRAILHIQDERFAHYAGPLTAWRVGLHNHGDARFLVTRQPNLIEAKPGNPTPFLRVIDDLIGVGVDPHAETQRLVLLGWFKRWIRALENAAHDPLQHIQGQILLIAGPPGLGKSFFTGLAALIGGDRSYDPEKSFSKDSRFNAELAGVTLAAVHDATLPADAEGVRMFWGNCKKLVANRDHSIEVKYGDARTLPLAGLRCIVTCNFGEEAAKILAPVLLEDGMKDKAILLRGHQPSVPHPPAGSTEANAKLTEIHASLPAFVWYLKNDFQLPAELQDTRYGVTTFQHPEIVTTIRSNHPDNPLADQIDAWLPQWTTGSSATVWEGTATELYSAIESCLGKAFTNSTTRPQHLGHQINRLRTQPGWADRIAVRTVWVGAGHNQQQRRWRIALPGQIAAFPMP